MEEQQEKYRENESELFDMFVRNCSQSSLSLSSGSLVCLQGLSSDTNQQQNKRGNYLTRLFEKKKLKEKFLSKKMKTPLNRKLYRTCWPVELGKVTKIKKKPREKKRKKPTQKSLRKKKFSSSNLLNINENFRNPFGNVVIENLDDLTFTECLRKSHFLYEPITPQLLMDVLKDPEHLKSGATMDMIIKKLRALKLHLNPDLDLLKEEILQKLRCGVKLGLVVERRGYFKVVQALAYKQLPDKKIDAFWSLWYRSIPCKKV